MLGLTIKSKVLLFKETTFLVWAAVAALNLNQGLTGVPEVTDPLNASSSGECCKFVSQTLQCIGFLRWMRQVGIANIAHEWSVPFSLPVWADPSSRFIQMIQRLIQITVYGYHSWSVQGGLLFCFTNLVHQYIMMMILIKIGFKNSRQSRWQCQLDMVSDAMTMKRGYCR